MTAGALTFAYKYFFIDQKRSAEYDNIIEYAKRVEAEGKASEKESKCKAQKYQQQQQQ